jgi:dTDP-4-dehydrorhamnose reductase
MLKLGAEKEVLKIVNDQWGAPTYAYTIAETTLKILTAVSNQENKHFGVYHLCDNNFTTWYHFACKIFELYRKSGRNLLLKEVIPISSEEFKSKAIRPKNSKMSTLKIQQTFGVHFLEWEKTLQNCMDIYLENTKN